MIGFMLVGLVAFMVAIPVAQAKGFKEGGGKDYKYCPLKSGLDSKFLHKAHFIAENAKDIGLSDQQADGIRNLKSGVKKEIIKRDAEINAIGVDIHDQLRQRPINADTVNALVDQKYELKKAKTKYVVGALAQLKASLSDEQYEAMKGLKQDR